MTIIVFFNHELRDTQAPSRTLTLQAGRGGDPELFWLSNGSKWVYLDARQAAEFLSSLNKTNACVRFGRLADRSCYSFNIVSYDGHELGIDLGILAGRPYIGIEDVRIDVSAEDLNYFAAACSHGGRHLAGGIGVAGRIAQTSRPARPVWENFASRFCNNGERPWYAD